MSRFRAIVFLSLCGLFLAAQQAFADGGAYQSFSPYSVFGLGQVYSVGTSYNMVMSGIGVATRNHKDINPQNPASVTARDSLSCMMDFSVYNCNKVMDQTGHQSANNIVAISDGIISFPIYRSSAMMVGIMPYTMLGYKMKGYVDQSDQSAAITGASSYAENGKGAVHQVFVAGAVTFWKRLSIGAEAVYYFGNIMRTSTLSFSDASMIGISSYQESQLRALTGKFGLQYEQPVGRAKICLGATYKMGTNMVGYLISSTQGSSYKYVEDTLANTPGRLRFADELGVGICLNYDEKLRIEFNYMRSDWRYTHLDTDPFFAVSDAEYPFTTTVAQDFRLGFEYVPNTNDIRYYHKRCAYRGGIYYSNDYYKVGGYDIRSMGLTLGVTLPVFRWYNGITVGLDFGHRGTMEAGLVKEWYFNFTAGVNLFDIWFQKPKYE